MKKICIITPNIFPVPAIKGGAVETLVEEILNENEKFHHLDITCLSAFDSKAYETSKTYEYTNFIFCKKNKNNKILNFLNRFTKKIFNLNIISYKYTKKIYKEISNNHYDYVIIEGGDPLDYETLIKKTKTQKFYLHVHGIIRGSQILNELYDGFICISEFVRNILIENGLIDSNKIYVLNNGIDIKQFSKKLTEEEKNDLKKKYNIKNNEIVLMFCGRTVQEKGIKETILAFKKLKNLEKCKLLIIGNSQFADNAKTKFEKELFEIAKEYKEKIIFTGFIPNKELYKIYNISDIAILPSLCEEAFGLSVLESMTSGLPIITTDAGAIPDLVKDSACIVNRDDNIVENITKYIDELIADKEKRKHMGELGNKLSLEYSLENFYTNFYNILEEN